MRNKIASATVVAGLSLLANSMVLAQQPVRETLTFPRELRGQAVQFNATLMLPPGTARVPAMIIQHGSAGVTEGREYRYARELTTMGVAALVIDSFKPRGVTNTVSDQSQVSEAEMTDDAVAALKQLAAHARIDAAKIGIMGFSKGGTVTLRTAMERYVARGLPAGPRFALHVSFYPGCGTQQYRPKMTSAPIYVLLGAADTYTGLAPCTELADKLKAAGARIEVRIYPGAGHGFDSEPAYNIPKGENWSRCIFEEQPDRTWRERTSGITTADATGQSIEAGRSKALAACRTYGVSGGPNPAARAAALEALKAAVRRHLIEGK